MPPKNHSIDPFPHKKVHRYHRGLARLYKEYAPDTEMPEHPVYFRVSQEYTDPDAILPVIPGNTHVRECLETVQHCMGSSRREWAGYSESHETMVTGALGKKATFATTARKSKEDDTPFYHKREVTKIQDKSPERFQERIAEAGMIQNAIAQTRSDQTL